ncbi:MAG: SpoIIE family protein phosphatase [Candidatus Riflebacteria bacterium]|nr:SpoIIE family protein phosphatase [Candidatus Riflebacteria bacterium]
MANFSTKQGTRTFGYLTAIFALAVFYLLVYWGLWTLERRHQDFKLQEFSRTASGVLEQMLLNADVEEFWVRQLNEDALGSSGHQEFIEKLRVHRKTSGEALTCVVWDEKGRVVLNDHFVELHTEAAELRMMWQCYKDIYNKGKSSDEVAVSNLRQLLGPHLDRDRLAAALYSRHRRLVRPDAAGNFPDFWVFTSGRLTALVFFDRHTVKDDVGLVKFCKEFNDRGMRVGFLNGRQQDQERGWPALLTSSIRQLEREGRSASLLGQTMLAGRSMAGMKTLFALNHYQPLLNPGKLTVFLLLISSFVLLILIKSAGGSVRMNRCPVWMQLLAILLVTTGLPLFCLVVAASDHVARKRSALIDNAYQACITYVQHVDRRSLINRSYMMHRVNRCVSAMKGLLPQKYGSQELIDEIVLQMSNTLEDIRLVASSSPVVMDIAGCYAGGRYKPVTGVKSRHKSNALFELKIFQDIATYYLSVVNGIPINFDKFNETELIAEMVYQRPFYEIIQNLLMARDTILALGWGDRTNPVLLKLLSLHDNNIFDYFFMVIFRDGVLQRDFLQRQTDNLERNPLGLKFIYSNGMVFSRDKQLVAESPWFKDIFAKTRGHPAVEPQFTTMDGEDYIFAGIHSQNLNNYYLYAFYPLAKIDYQIKEERKFMLSAGAVGVILLLGLALVFASSFVSPLSALQAGAIAIRKRDFSYRLPELSADEFGEMARVFNSSITDFEELMLAGIVQSRLLPQQGISDSRFDLYGRNIPMTELGGDYFDYFHVEGSGYVVMAGDVAGHGVGASLIMAMAKAGVMRCQDCIKDPAAVLARLHQIVHETRTKIQRKIMTFQYLFYDADSGVGVYSNAGACSPILVDHASRETAEITLQAPVLGGFKKSRFANLDIKLKAGQALVFYTDGIIETMNSQGREIGYEGFKQILLESYDLDARKYYDNIYGRYLKWLGDNQPQDDLTIIILVRR